MTQRWGRQGSGSPVSELLRGISEQLGLPLPAGCQTAWRRAVGDNIARHSRPIELRRGLLKVQVEGPAWGRMLDEIGAVLVQRLVREGLTVSEVELIEVESATWQARLELPRSDG